MDKNAELTLWSKHQTVKLLAGCLIAHCCEILFCNGLIPWVNLNDFSFIFTSLLLGGLFTSLVVLY